MQLNNFQNAVSFSQGITTDDLVKDITQFLDQVMALYNLIGVRDDIAICADHNKGPMTFVLVMSSSEQAAELYSRLYGYAFEIYGNSYYTNMIQNGNSVDIAFIAETP